MNPEISLCRMLPPSRARPCPMTRRKPFPLGASYPIQAIDEADACGSSILTDRKWFSALSMFVPSLSMVVVRPGTCQDTESAL
ncbi:Uncharacterised protein [Mycobacteroides abscessus subsp. abscessus]|nr:Uncharacterised protein [Mycobacteroides abscessus subsp. abscessus]